MKIMLILGTGVIAGFLNVVGGGGSLLTMPILIFMGMPAALANGTNRVALFVQNVTAVVNFKRKGYYDLKLSLLLGVPAMLGAVLGARIALDVPDDVFNKILAVVMFIVLFLIIKKPNYNNGMEEMLNPKRKTAAVITFFFVGIYGGFVQAGVGFIIIATLSVLTNMSLVKINSLKVFIVLFYMVTSLMVFLWNGKVDFTVGLVLAVGNSIGGWLGSSFAVAKGDKWIRIFLIAAIVVMAAKLAGLVNLIM